MTANQSLPARPDGEQVTEYVRELNTIAAECEIAGTAELSRAAHNLYRIAKQWFKSLPARDAAEGGTKLKTFDPRRAGFTLQDCGCIGDRCEGRTDGTCHDDLDRARGSREYPLAPPKPAPDAVRTALERMLAAFKGMMPFPLVVQAVAEGLVRDAEAALSAPVPPADGAGHRYMTTEEIANAKGMIRSPSATGAAEPVAWRWKPHGSVTWIYDPHPNWFAEHKDEIDHEPLYATPPVRGDRTIFYSILTKYYPKDATMDAAWQELKEAGVVP